MHASKSKKETGDLPQTVRQSVSFPLELHQTLEKIAETKKVSLAWVVRDAVEKYVADRWPLLNER